MPLLSSLLKPHTRVRHRLEFFITFFTIIPVIRRGAINITRNLILDINTFLCYNNTIRDHKIKYIRTCFFILNFVVLVWFLKKDKRDKTREKKKKKLFI